MLAPNNSASSVGFPVNTNGSVSNGGAVKSAEKTADVNPKPVTSWNMIFGQNKTLYPVITPVPYKVSPYDYVKRLLDIVGASLLLIALTPLMLLIALAIKFGSRGPVIFKQGRLTAGGRVFTMYKFRTMASDAEKQTGPVWASFSDPRVTSIGRFLRITRLDELPQLVNVIKGEMSLIGPRPERPEIAAELMREFPNFSRRLEVKGGITGLAQIATGYASTLRGYKRKLSLDIKYIDNRCMLLDLRIALRTIVVVLTGTGAR